MKTLLLLVGLLLTWENGRVLGDQMVSDTELQGKWNRCVPSQAISSLPGPEAVETHLLCSGPSLSGPPSRSYLV